MMNRCLLTLLLVAGCSHSPSGAAGGGGNGSDGANQDLGTSPPDMTVNNPRNTVGSGPAPVEIGSAANLGSAASYALLAKTGITNVTGSAITGGNVGVSPAAATAITGFGM